VRPARIGDPTTSELPPAAWELLGLIDGRRSAQALAAETDLAEGTTFGLLAELVAAGVAPPGPDAVVAPPLVLVLSGDATERRLLRLTLLRHGVRPHLLATSTPPTPPSTTVRPSAVIVDARIALDRLAARRCAGAARARTCPCCCWAAARARWWQRWRGPMGDRLPRPYREADVQAWLDQRLAVAAAADRATPGLSPP
jgi:hypothetical protein